MFAKRVTFRSKQYREWVATLPCCICGQQSEPHHLIGIGGMSGMGIKAPDSMCMPLCHTHHMEMHSKDGDKESQWEMIARTLDMAISIGKLKWSK